MVSDIISQAEINREVDNKEVDFADLSDIDKKRAWEGIIWHTREGQGNNRWRAIELLIHAFPLTPDKQQAWKDLHNLSKEEHQDGVRWSSAYAIGVVFSHIPEKQEAWEDLIQLVKDGDIGVQYSAAEAIINAFPDTPDKQKAWNDLRLLVKDKFLKITLIIFVKIFSYIPDHKQVWDDLFRLAKDKDFKGRWNVAYALGEVLHFVPDKQKAWEDLWEDLFRQTKNEYRDAHLRRSMIDQMIKKKIKEIQKTAEKVYQESKGTPKEEIAGVVNQIVQNWVISDQVELTKNVNQFIRYIKLKIPNYQANKEIYDIIENINKEKDIVRLSQQFTELINQIPQTQIIIGGNMSGDIFSNVHIQGNGIVVGSNNIVSINQQQLAKIPDEYAKSLQAFSEAVNAQLKKHNISQEKTAPVQESINELVKEVESIKPEENIDIEKKEDIKDKIKKVAIRLLKILPEGAETIATLTPLAPFSKIIGKGVEEIVKEFQK